MKARGAGMFAADAHVFPMMSKTQVALLNVPPFLPPKT